ncbi:unnamed protein product [Lymnaea stagnalis]|uniref:Thioredoxin n=1 Tax=Lymnaea stagnalis TaxID=6523 RepID=A0AAV2HUQ0_LYMST
MIRPKPRLHLIKRKEEYDLILKESGKLIVVYFFATWCGPCKKIAPYIEQLLSLYENLVFAKINIEDNLELAESENVAALPTFHFYKDGVKLREMVGANNEHLKELIESFI